MKRKEMDKIILKYVQHNLETYKQNEELIKLYDQYTKNVTELFDFLMNGNSNLFYTILFANLMEIGFFSANCDFDHNAQNFKELNVKPGISVINGAGVCRNITCFYEDVFKKLYNYPLKLCCLDQNGLLNEDTKTYGNHVINLTIYRDAIFGFDIFNNCPFKAIGPDKLTGLGFDYQLNYVPNGDIILYLTTALNNKDNINHEILLKHSLLEISSMRDVLSFDEYSKMVNDTVELIDQKDKLLRDFLKQNEELTTEIKKKVLSLK